MAPVIITPTYTPLVFDSLPTSEVYNMAWTSNRKYLLCVQGGSPYFVLYQRNGVNMTKLTNSVQFTGTSPVLTATGGNIAGFGENGNLLMWSNPATPFARDSTVDQSTGIMNRPATTYGISGAAPSVAANYVDRAADWPQFSGSRTDFGLELPSIFIRNVNASPFIQIFRRWTATQKYQFVNITAVDTPPTQTRKVVMNRNGAWIVAGLETGGAASYALFSITWADDWNLSLTRRFRDTTQTGPKNFPEGSVRGMQWHPTLDYFAWASVGSADSYSVAVGKINSATTYSMIPLPGIGLGVGNAYDVQWSLNGKYLFATFGADASRIMIWYFDAGTETFTLLTRPTTGLGTQPRAFAVGRNNDVIAVSASTSPFIAGYVSDFSEKADATLAIPFQGVALRAKNVLGSIATLAIPFQGINLRVRNSIAGGATLAIPFQGANLTGAIDSSGDGVVNYPTFGVESVVGIFPPIYPALVWKPSAIIAGMSSAVTVVTAADPFLFGDMAMPAFGVAYNIKLTSTGNAELVYSSLEVNGRLGRVDIEGDLEYSTISTDGLIANYRVARAAVQYQRFLARSTVALEDQVNLNYDYPTYVIKGLVGVNSAYALYTFPKYEISGVAEINLLEGHLAYPAYTLQGSVDFNYGSIELNYPSFTVTGLSEFSYGDGAYTYPSFGMEGLSEFSYGDGTIEYPAYSMVGELSQPYGDIVINYPAYSAEGLSEFIYSENSNWGYPSYSIAAEFVQSYGSGEWTYPSAGISGVLDQTYGSGEWTYSNYSAEGILEQRYVIGDFNYSPYEVDGDLGNPLGSRIDAIYPAFVVEVIGRNPLLTDTDIQYQPYAITGDINVPIRVDSLLEYAKLKIDGYTEVAVEVRNSNLSYPVFIVRGTGRYTTSVDLLAKYPKFTVSGLSARVTIANIAYTLPKFTGAGDAEGYYGVDFQTTLTLDMNGDAERLKSRRELLITER